MNIRIETFSLLLAAIVAQVGCKTALPVISPQSGAVTCPYTVTMADTTPNAAIHYTTDGSLATPASAVYSAPVALQSGATVNAVATSPSASPSDMAQASYTCSSGGGGRFSFVQFTTGTGGDDARQDSEVVATLNAVNPSSSGPLARLELKAQGQASWSNGTTNDQTFTLPTPVAAADIGSVTITLVQHGSFPETEDNWNMQTLHVRLFSQSGGQVNQQACLVNVSGNPFARLTGSAGSVTVPATGC